MVASMAYRDTEVAAVPDVAEGALARTPPDWRRLYEQTLERAEAAEARAEELKWAEVVARSAAESLKWQFKEARRKRLAAVEDANEARRAAKNALFLEAEVARLTQLLGEAGVDPQPRGTEISLRREIARLRQAGAGAQTALDALTKENARLRRTAKASQGRVGTLEAELSKLRATAAVLSGTLYGRRSEKQQTPRCGRRRGQRSGAPGHGRTPRPGIEERLEVHAPPAEARVCAACGKSYAANGADESSLLEIEVRAHRRVIRRGRWRRRCGCASSPLEVSAPAVPRLFPSTPYGTSVWSRFLFEHYACLRPLQRVAAWLGDQGLPVAPGTLADSAPRFVPLFQPLAEAAATLFGELRSGTVIVCDRYSAYKKLARLLGGMVTLQFCWAHMRRDFIQCAAAQVDLTGWCQAWLARIAAIYRLNEARLARYDPTVERQSAVFDAAQDALQAALDGLFARAGRELDGLQEHAREGKALRSLVNHREGLSVFVARPRTPMDNNFAYADIRIMPRSGSKSLIQRGAEPSLAA